MSVEAQELTLKETMFLALLAAERYWCSPRYILSGDDGYGWHEEELIRSGLIMGHAALETPGGYLYSITETGRNSIRHLSDNDRARHIAWFKDRGFVLSDATLAELCEGV